MKKGFTLIELLVVVAILGILSALVIVNLSGSKAKARDNKKKTDVASIATAIKMFHTDKETYSLADAGCNCGLKNAAGTGFVNQESSSNKEYNSMSIAQWLLDNKYLESTIDLGNKNDYMYYPGSGVYAKLEVLSTDQDIENLKTYNKSDYTENTTFDDKNVPNASSCGLSGNNSPCSNGMNYILPIK